MTKSEVKKRIAKLRRVINRHSYLCHVLDKPEISDAAWNSVKQELGKLEECYPDFLFPSFPIWKLDFLFSFIYFFALVLALDNNFFFVIILLALKL